MHDTRRGADLLPTDMIRFRHTERVFREEAIRWGYQEVRTPTIEPLSLFTAAGTLDPGMLDNLYSFLDWDGWSGERVVLRPDGTIPIGRLFTERLSGHGRARLFHISNTFSYDEDGTSEHWQCGVEYLDGTGRDRAEADTEVASLALSVLTKLGFERPHLRVGYPPLIRAVLGTMELSGSRRREVTEYIRTRNIQGLKGLSDIQGMKKLLGFWSCRHRRRTWSRTSRHTSPIPVRPPGPWRIFPPPFRPWRRPTSPLRSPSPSPWCSNTTPGW